MSSPGSGPARHLAAVVAFAVVVALAVGGCGAGAALLQTHSSRTRPIVTSGVSASAVRVIRGWSDALRDGRVAVASAFFRLPSVFFDGSGPPIELRTRAEVEQVNGSLPCGATLISVSRHGRFVNALFRLGSRQGVRGATSCGSGTGLTARTDFLIQGGRILEWLRAPDEPGDNGSRRSPPSPPAPSSTTGGGPLA